MRRPCAKIIQVKKSHWKTKKTENGLFTKIDFEVIFLLRMVFGEHTYVDCCRNATSGTCMFVCVFEQCLLCWCVKFYVRVFVCVSWVSFLSVHPPPYNLLFSDSLRITSALSIFYVEMFKGQYQCAKFLFINSITYYCVLKCVSLM